MAPCPAEARTVRLDRRALLRGTALQGAFALALLLPAGQAEAQLSPGARPQGGTVSAGAAVIAAGPGTTTISQSSQNAAINWSSFNLGSGQSVQITAPNSRAVTVNRVAAGNPSQIAGSISDNGVFVLTNPSGVVFAKGAQVTASSVIVTTAGVTDQNVKAGKLAFDQPGDARATVVNRGRITVAQAGLAALVAPGVANAGVISAKLGKVVLAGAAASTVDLYGDGLMSVDVTKQVSEVPAGADGKPVAALVTNTGVITATGGRVLLTARAVDGLVTNLVDAGGRVAADTSAAGKTGRVVIAGIGGSVTIDGAVSAAGKVPGTTGGAIEINARGAVSLTPRARVTASGSAGGGTVAIGTSLKRVAGGSSVPRGPVAQAVSIAAGALVSANALRQGNGGLVTVQSTRQTTVAGTISATGGSSGGDGGFVEVSGQGGYALTGAIDVTAAMGNAGTILLDPTNLIVTSGSAGSGSLDGTLGTGNTIAAGTSSDAGNTDNVSNAEIETLSGTIVLQAGALLAIADNTPVTLKKNASLVLTTGSGIITIGTLAPVTASGTGSIVLDSGGSIALGSAMTTSGSGAILLRAASGIGLQGATLTTGLLGLTAASGSVTQASGGAINAGTVTGSAGVVALAGSLNAIGTLGSFSAGSFLLNDRADLTVTGPVNASSVTVNGGGALLVNGAIGASAGGTTLTATGPVTIAGGALVWSQAGTVDLEAGGGFSQTGGAINGQGVVVNAAAGNIVQSGGTIAAVGAVGLTASGGGFAESGGVIAANGAVTVLGTGGFTINAGTVIAGGALRLGTGGTLAMTGGLLAAGSDITIGGSAAGSYTGGSVTQSGGTIASGGTLYADAGGDLLLTAGGTRFAATLNVDSTGTTDVNLTGGAVTVALGGTLVDTGGGALPGPVPSAQNFVPGGLGRETMVIAGGAILIDQPEVAGALALFAHGGTVVGNINETATGSIDVGPLEGYARNGGSVSLNQGTNFIGTLLAFSNGLTAAFASDGDFRLTDQESLGIPGALLIGIANAGTVNTGSLYANGYIVVGGSIGGGSGSTVANVTLDTGTLAGGGGILIGGAVGAIGTAGNGGTVALNAALNITEAGGTLVAYQLTGSTGNGAASDASANLSGAGGGNLVQTLGSFVTDRGGGAAQAGLILANGRDLVINGPVNASTVTVNVAGALLVSGTIGASAGGTTLTATGPVTISGGALVWSQAGTVDLEAGGGFTQTGGAINGQGVFVNAAAGNIVQSGGTIAAVGAVGLDAAAGGFAESGGVVAANGAVTVLGTGGFTINAGTVIAGGALRLGSGGTLAITGGLLAAGSDITIGGSAAGSYTGGSITQSGGTIASGGTLYADAGGDLLLTAGGTRFAATLNVDSTGTTDVNLTGGAVTIALGGTLVDTGGGALPGPVPSAQNFVPGGLGRETMVIAGGAILIDQPEVAGALALFAHGGTVVGNINETATGSIDVGPLEGYARNGGSVSLNQGTNFIGTLLAFSNGLTAAFASDGDFRLTDQESLGIPGALLIGIANAGTVNTGSLYANGYIVVGGSIGAGSNSTVANVTLDTGSQGGGILIGGAVGASGTAGNGGTVALNAALNIAEAGGTLAAYQLTGSTGNGAASDASADLSGAGSGNLIQTLGRFTTNRGGGATQADFVLTNGRDLTVTGPVTAADVAITLHTGGGTGGSLTVAGSGSLVATNGAVSGLPVNGNVSLAADGAISVQGLVAGGSASTVALTADAAGAGGGSITVGNDGLVSVQSYVPLGGGLVRPGTIRLQTDALTLAGTLAVFAPDGLIEIAPRTAGHVISLDSVVANGPTTLSLGVATLDAISTRGTLATGLPGAGALLLGSLDGSTSNVAAINITAPVSLPDIQTLALFSNGAVTESGNGALAVNALAGYGTALLLGSGANAIAQLGVASQGTQGGATYRTDTAFLNGSAGLLSNLRAGAGSIRVHDTSGTLDVIGTLIAAAGQTVDLAAPGLLIDATASGSAVNAGSLDASGGQILLAADSLRIESAGTAPIVTAPQGLVAITPYSASHTISVDALAQSSSTDLSLATGDLALIRTLAGSTTALGSQTLMIGSQDGGVTLPNAGIVINAPLRLAGTVANTLALYSAGSVTGSGAITVDTLTGRAGVTALGGVGGAAGDFLLTGGNAIGSLGAVVASGNVSIVNAGDLTQLAGTTVQAGDDPALAVHGGTSQATAAIRVLAGTLTIDGTVQGGSDGALLGNVVLNAGGAVVIAPTGSLFAANGGSVGVTASGDIGIGGAIWGERSTGRLAGTVDLVAGGSIDEPFAAGRNTAGIGAVFLTGSAGGHAILLGDGTPTLNRIATLGPFTTNGGGGGDSAGLQVRDGQALTVTGQVSDLGRFGQGVAITVAPAGAPSGGSGDLVLAGSVSALTAVTLQATGNVFETAGGVISAPTLAAQAGMVPTTEGGQAPGSYAAGDVTSTAAVSLGGANQVASVSGVTATGNVLLSDSRDLSVTGTVLAGVGAGAASAGGIGNAAGTAVSPYAEIDVAGNLTVAGTGIVHAGLDSAVAGNVTLRAGNATVAGSVSVNGDAYAANGGTVSVEAGYDPATGGYNSVASGSGISVNGVLGGDRTGIAVAGLVNLLAAGSIDEASAAASIQAGLLTGRAGGHADLSETSGGALATTASANRIAELGGFIVNAGTADPMGLALRDGEALTVTGPVSSTGAGISIAVAPGSGSAYAIADLVLNGTVTAGTVVNLQATGNVFEQAGGGIVAGTLTSQSGYVPGTEATGNVAGTDPPALGIGVDVFGGVNQVGTLGNVTASGDFLLSNGPSLLVNGTVLAGTSGSAAGVTGAATGVWGTALPTGGVPFAEIDVLAAGGGNLTVAPSAVIHSGIDGGRTGNVTLRAGGDAAPGSVLLLGSVYAAHGGTVTISAGFNPATGGYGSVVSGSGIVIDGTIGGDQAGLGLAGLVNLGAAASIDQPVAASDLAASLLTGHAGGHANLSETAAGGLGTGGSGNRIAALGTFVSNAGTDDPQGLRLRDGQSLTVTGPVTDQGASASLGISIAVVPDPAATYTSGNLTIAGAVTAATRVNLQATGSVAEQGAGAITARTLTTQAGVVPDTEATGNAAGTYPALIVTPNAGDILGSAVNQIGTLANATVTGTLALNDARSLIVAGNVLGGVTPEASSVAGGTLIGTSVSLATPGLLSVTGTLTVASQSGVLALSGGTIALTGAPVLRAATMEIAGATSISIGNGTTFYTGGDVFARPGPDLPPVDPGTDSPGAHLLAGAGGVAQTGTLTVLPYAALTPAGAVVTTHPELDIRLAAGTGTVGFDPAYGLISPAASLLLDLGGGNAIGHIVAFDVATFYTSMDGAPTLLIGTLYSANGSAFTDQSAASDAFIAQDGNYVPSNGFQVNGCAFASLSCVQITPFGPVPQGSPLRDLPSAFFEDQSDDPDLTIPNVTDRVN